MNKRVIFPALSLVFAMGVFYCMFFIKPKPPQPPIGDVSGISVEQTPEELRFERVYTATTKYHNIKVIVKIKELSGLWYTGELDQPNGKWVLFDPEAPADKILDPQLLPEVEQLCKQIIALDKEFRAAPRTSITDDKKRIWKQVQ